MSTSDYLSIISLIITMVMGLPGTILAIIQIRDALKPGKGHQRPQRRSRGHRRRCGRPASGPQPGAGWGPPHP